jgi:hypothetical protein
MESEYRPLSTEEIARLNEQGCSCSDWSKVEVAEGFDPVKVKSTHFSGSVKLGVFAKQVSFLATLQNQRESATQRFITAPSAITRT